MSGDLGMVGLIGPDEMARLVGYKVSSLQRRKVRMALVKRGCPAPVVDSPPRWNRAAVLRWIDPEAYGLPKDVEEDAAARWRRELTAAYGAAGSAGA